MLIDSLRISAFRGIQTELNLDLTARLTLIHAPNGTGKTSVCDATEWLFTGAVHRLATALRDSSSGGVRNLFAGSRETAVEAQLSLGSSTLNVRRNGVGTDERLEQRSPTWRKLDQGKLMEQLAPSNLPAGSTRQQNLNRTAWFRAVRLLETSDLEFLLDDTKGAQDVRELLFSNLFGTSELQSREQTLEKIRDAMVRPGRVEADMEKVRAEIQEIEAMLNSAGEHAEEPFLTSARQHLAAAALFLNTTVDDETPVSHATNMLESLRASEEARIARSRVALGNVTREWDRFQATAAEISGLEKAQAAETEQVGQLVAQVASATAVAQDLAAASIKSSQQEMQLRALSPDQLSIRLNEALNQWQIAGATSSDRVDVVVLRAAEDGAMKRKAAFERQYNAFANCKRNLPHWLEQVGDLHAAEERRGKIELPTSDAVSANNKALSDSRDQLRRIQAESEQLAAPLERLRNEGRRLLDSLPDEHRCPLCAHDHETPMLLRDAIDSGLKALPVALSVLAGQKTAQEKIAVESEERKKTWTEAIAEMAQINKVIESVRRVLDEATDTLKATGANFPDLSRPEFLERFKSAETSLVVNVEAEGNNASRLTALRVAGESLDAVRKGILFMANELRSVSSEEFDDSGIVYSPPSEWNTEIERLTLHIKSVLGRAANDAAVAVAAANSYQRDLDALSSKLVAWRAAIDLRAARLGELRSAILPIAADWNNAAGKTPMTKEALDALPQRLAQAADDVGKSATELSLAIENLGKANEASEREREAVANRNKLDELRASLLRLVRIGRRRAELDQAVTQLRDAKESFVNRQIQPLCSVITALYLRAQSNAFITAIGTDDRGGAHRWTANADDSQLEAIAQLSQGQRQDFALAIFLARARDVRGTFFLDEPLLHLDDLNRVALLDVLRVLLLESGALPLRLVITTSSNSLVRHFREKFSLLPSNDHGQALRAYSLSGNPRSGVTAIEDRFGSR